MNIDITSSATQQATAAQITALANHILHRRGQVDFTGTNVSVQCSDSLPLGAAAIVQTCAHKQGATSFSISGASDLSEEDWAVIEQGIFAPSIIYLILGNTIPLANFYTAYGYDNNILKSFDGTGRWLVSDGTAYIDTSIVMNCTNSYMLEVKSYNISSVGMFGSRTYSSEGTANSDSFNIFGNGYFDYFARYISGITSGTANTFKVTPTQMLFNGEVVATGAKKANGTYPLLLCATNTNGSISKSKSSFSMFSEYGEDGNATHFFIPMTKDSVNGMYDLIGQQFYTNANTSGAFTIE